MKKYSHILWDLDGTLIHSNTSMIVIKLAWFFWSLLKTQKSYVRRFDIFWQTWQFHSQLNTDLTVYENLVLILSRVSHWPESETKLFLNKFYEQEFSKLSKQFAVIPEAYQILKKANNHFSQALLTNPLLPLKCTLDKMTWSGIESSFFKYISHSQNSHFLKPDLRYYEESLQAIGAEPSECCLIGDSHDNDGVAEKIGIDVFIVNKNSKKIWKELSKKLFYLEDATYLHT